MKFGIYTLIIESSFRKKIAFDLAELESLRSSSIFESGWGNGYVLLPPNHPFYGKDYDDLGISIHGGLTFGSNFDSEYFLEWTKDLQIEGDVNVENFEKFDNYWMIGFDTAHYGDDIINCSLQYVINETENLLDQCLDDNIKGIKKYKSFYLRKDKLKKLKEISIIDKTE